MTNKEAAHFYAATLGWLVFPVMAGDKRPLTAHGLHDATKDAAQIERWWTQYPDASIGVRTGGESGIVVLDVDQKNDGPTSLRKLCEYHGELPIGPVANTGGGGYHFVFKHPGPRCRNSVSSLGLGLDVRADGGYFICAPSMHASGIRYSWKVDTTVEVPHMPEWLRDKIISPVSASRSEFSATNPMQTGEIVREGGRNHALARMGGILRAQGHDLEQITALLLVFNEKQLAPPLSETEVRNTAASISRYPAGPPLVETLTGEPPWDLPDSLPMVPATELPIEETDLGNARRLSQHHGDDLKYVHDWKKWLIWSGRHWEVDDSGEIMRRAHDTAGRIALEARAAQQEFDKVSARVETDSAAMLNNNGGDHHGLDAMRKNAGVLERRVATLFKHAKESQSSRACRAMVEMASCFSELSACAGQLDSDPFLLNLNNGTLDLRTGAIRDHMRSDNITKLVNITFDPAATCPNWEAWLDEIMLGNTSLISFLQRAVGYSLTGSVEEQCVFFMLGEGENGKSTFIEVCQALLGSYAGTASADVLTVGDRHATELATFQGRRFMYAGEPKNKRLDTDRLKRLASSEPISARRMREDEWEFMPTHKLWLAANTQPPIEQSDHGTWRRLHMIPFHYRVKRRIKNLKQDKLLPELAGILNWALIGTRAVLENGIQPPAEVTAATEQYRQEEDQIGNFIREMTERGPGFTAPAKPLFVAYQLWAESGGFKAEDIKKFKRAMTAAGFVQDELTKGNFWLGIRLIPVGIKGVENL